MAEPLVRVAGMSKRFGGFLAVDNVSLAAEPGCITALIGPNGAGKTTLFALMSGFLPPSAGRLYHRGLDVTGQKPFALARRGIARTFQIVRPFVGLTVLENIAIGAHLTRPSRADARDEAARIGTDLGLGPLLDRPAASLTVAGRKRLEVARAVATGADLLLLDEVLAGLNPTEVAAMVPMIRALVERGITIVMIEHVMQAVMSLAQHVYVLAHGRLLAEGAPHEVVRDARVVEAYLGRSAAGRLSAAAQPHG